MILFLILFSFSLVNLVRSEQCVFNKTTDNCPGINSRCTQSVSFVSTLSATIYLYACLLLFKSNLFLYVPIPFSLSLFLEIMCNWLLQC
jgi:hypothetical protein